MAIEKSLDVERLREREIHLSLICLVAIPYLRAKAHDCYESLGGGVQSDMAEEGPRSQPLASEQSTSRFLKTSFKTAYPWFNVTFESWLMFYNVAYLFDRTAFYRPWLSWIGVDFRRLGLDDIRHEQTLNRSLSSVPVKSWRAMLRYMILRTPRLLLDSLKILLPTTIFFLKFLEWWYSPSSPVRSIATSNAGPAIPPPTMLTPHPQGIAVEHIKFGECPLCRGPIANATALPSGYVFCYRCAYAYVEEHRKCPVTFLPVYIWQLRKILV